MKPRKPRKPRKPTSNWATWRASRARRSRKSDGGRARHLCSHARSSASARRRGLRYLRRNAVACKSRQSRSEICRAVRLRSFLRNSLRCSSEDSRLAPLSSRALGVLRETASGSGRSAQRRIDATCFGAGRPGYLPSRSRPRCVAIRPRPSRPRRSARHLGRGQETTRFTISPAAVVRDEPPIISVEAKKRRDSEQSLPRCAGSQNICARARDCEPCTASAGSACRMNHSAQRGPHGRTG